MKWPKRRCEETGATAYQDPHGVFRSIIEDHERFETCFDCGHLVGWCPNPDTCQQGVWVDERRAKAEAAKPKRKTAAKKKAPAKAAKPAATASKSATATKKKVAKKKATPKKATRVRKKK